MKRLRILAAVFLLAASLTGCMASGSASEEMTEPMLRENTKIVCMGDSITYGYGVSRTRSEDAWTAVLQEKLGEDRTVVNCGIVAVGIQRDNPCLYVQSGVYRRAMEENGDLYLIMLGTNDAHPSFWDKETYKEDLQALIEEVRALPSKPQVILLQPPACFPQGELGYGFTEKIIGGELYDAIAEVGENVQCPVIDLHSVTADREELFPDGVHPDREGNLLIAETIAAFFQ